MMRLAAAADRRLSGDVGRRILSVAVLARFLLRLRDSARARERGHGFGDGGRRRWKESSGGSSRPYLDHAGQKDRREGEVEGKEKGEKPKGKVRVECRVA